MLRSDLRFSYKHLQLSRVNDINGNEDENHTIEDAKITITDVNYLFDSHHTLSGAQWDDDDDPTKPAYLTRQNLLNRYDYLSLLMVFVVIDWGYEKKEYSLQYRIYADACGRLLLLAWKVVWVDCAYMS